MDQQQTGSFPATTPVLEKTVLAPVNFGVPVQQDDVLTPEETTSTSSWLYWLGMVAVVVVVLLLIYFFFVRGRIGNYISISPQELSTQFSIDKVVISKSGFLVLIMGNDFNGPGYAFYSSPLLPPGSYENVVVNIDENNYKDLLGTYRPNTKLFAYLFGDDDKNGEFDNVNGAAYGQGADKPIRDLTGNVVFMEILRPQ